MSGDLLCVGSQIEVPNVQPGTLRDVLRPEELEPTKDALHKINLALLSYCVLTLYVP